MAVWVLQVALRAGTRGLSCCQGADLAILSTQRVASVLHDTPSRLTGAHLVPLVCTFRALRPLGSCQ